MSRIQALSLYKRILRLHRQKLPDLYRSVGDKVRAINSYFLVLMIHAASVSKNSVSCGAVCATRVSSSSRCKRRAAKAVYEAMARLRSSPHR